MIKTELIKKLPAFSGDFRFFTGIFVPLFFAPAVLAPFKAVTYFNLSEQRAPRRRRLLFGPFVQA
jgi:hypothetical protein